MLYVVPCNVLFTEEIFLRGLFEASKGNKLLDSFVGIFSPLVVAGGVVMGCTSPVWFTSTAFLVSPISAKATILLKSSVLAFLLVIQTSTLVILI